MPTTTTGTFFIGKDNGSRKAISTHQTPEGQFVLKMRVIDNQGGHSVEAYLVRWIGAEAQTWWLAHGPLTAGAPLALDLVNPRSFMGLRTPEIHADVARCRLLPTRAQASAAGANPFPQAEPDRRAPARAA